MRKYKDQLVDWFFSYELKDKHAIWFLVFSALVLFSPLLFFGKILLGGDATYGAYPLAYFFSHFAGSPIAPFTFSGYPVAMGFQYGYFHPLHNLFFPLFDFLFTYHFLVFLDFCGAAIITYLFARKIGLGVYASLLSGLAYTFSQQSMAWPGIISISHAVFLLPAVFYCMLEIANRKIRYIFILGLVLGVAFLGTHYQFIIIALIGGGIFFLFEIWQKWNREESFWINVKPIFYLAIGFFIALVISLPAVLGNLSFFGESTRQTTLVYSSASYLDLIRFLIPTWKIPYISLDEFRAYIGLLPFFLALLALWQVWRRKIIDKRSVFFSVFAIITLIMSLQYSPFLLVIRFIPYVKYFAVQSRWMFLSNFGLIILAGYGFDFVLKNLNTFPREKVIKFLKWTSVSIITFFAFSNLALYIFGHKIITFLQNYFDSNMYANTTGLPLSYYHDIIEVLARNTFFNFSFSNLNIVIFIISFLCLYWLMKVVDRKVLFSNLAVLFVCLNVLSVSAVTFDLGDRHLLTDKSNIAEYIHAHEKSVYDYRVFNFAVLFAQYQMITATHPEAERESLSYAREALMANLNIISQIPIVAGYDTLAFRRYQNVVAFLENTTARKTTEEKVSVLLTELPLISALNVKYIVTPCVLESPNLSLVFSEKVTSFNVPLYLYQNKKVLPRFYLAKSVALLPENDEAGSFVKITEAKSDFKDVTFIECDNCQTGKTAEGSMATLITQNDKHIEIVVKSPSPEWLVLSNEAISGWHVTIDGNPVRIYYANHAYMGINIPKGEHKVIFSYSIFPDLIK